MENQHRKISGYRELSQAEIDLMNEVKALGPTIEAVVETDFQTALMCLTRAVAQPTFF